MFFSGVGHAVRMTQNIRSATYHCNNRMILSFVWVITWVSSAIWEIIARATGKVIARAIASAIYDCCECNYSQMAREYM